MLFQQFLLWTLENEYNRIKRNFMYILGTFSLTTSDFDLKEMLVINMILKFIIFAQTFIAKQPSET